MSIYSEISRINSAKTNIVTAIEGKGVSVPSGYSISQLPALISQISGGSLAFDVISYPDDVTLLADVPAKNMAIGIVPSIAPTNWIATPAPPDNPTNGLVWIRNSAAGILLPIYEDSQSNTVNMGVSWARQYVSGAWVTISAYAWFNHEWKSLTLRLFEPFNQHLEVTGGIKITSQHTSATISPSTGYITVPSPGSASMYTSVFTMNPIDITDKTTLFINFQSLGVYQSSGCYLRLGISANPATAATGPTTWTYNQLTFTAAQAMALRTFPVGAYAGNYYVGYMTYGVGSAVSEIYLV